MGKEEVMGRRRVLYSLVVVVICLARRSLLEIKRVKQEGELYRITEMGLPYLRLPAKTRKTPKNITKREREATSAE